ncbi:50S ribosomal protein L11 methyltransferase [Methylotetracoccus oryzae]|uniref:50S ribosomal protein L11 methyltransferase n=1 Tax=Methylotetracoccus oryzae TaxID=1919059 RepID=UPI001118D686|nr:50S ribosomal protein L11 methyltransferase [Methylotetracoccus oryzae]
MWRQLAVEADEHVAEAIADALSDDGALSVSLQDAGDVPLFEPKPGETPIWARTRVIGLFPEEADLDTVRRNLMGRFGQAVTACDVESLEDRVWEREWLEHFRPVCFGRRLWVSPTGFAVDEPGAVVVTLDPGLAFGTGSHPTTALCLEWLDGQNLSGCAVIDYGCGSGILAVAALVLGAAEAHAVDIDPQALLATEDNAAKNGVAERVRCAVPDQFGREVTADIVMANILANPLIDLAGELSRRVRAGGWLVLSGILAEQGADVAHAYAAGFEFAPVAQREGWVRLVGRKRG